MELDITQVENTEQKELEDFTCMDDSTIAVESPKIFNARLRVAILRNQANSQATLIVDILRSYFANKNCACAAKFLEKVNFPEVAHNNCLARFNYYQGRVKAFQLEYSSAFRFFQQALQKAPQDSAIAFKQNVQKWVVVVSLLQGEIPERQIFRMPIYRTALIPYLKLTRAVRLGSIQLFNEVLTLFSETFEFDETLNLIICLRPNVIKTALRQTALTYSRISIAEIAKKLQLQSELEAEYVVEKAIKEKIICGTIDYDPKNNSRYLQSNEATDVYRTTEPQFVFDSRIKNCLALHNDAVKALRYPSDTKNGEMESIEKQREREILETEFASEMADEDDDF